MTAKDAVGLLESMGYRARVNGYGKVVAQQPQHGSVVKKGSIVVLTMK
jgi:cell division protein FtsI (penicillin-binding protein 3)